MRRALLTATITQQSEIKATKMEAEMWEPDLSGDQSRTKVRSHNLDGHLSLTPAIRQNIKRLRRAVYLIQQNFHAGRCHRYAVTKVTAVQVEIG